MSTEHTGIAHLRYSMSSPLQQRHADGPIWKPTGAIAACYDELCLNMDSFERAQRFLASIVFAYCERSASEKRLLEVGCGTGITTGFLLAGVENICVTALDSDKVMLAAAERRVRVYKSRVKFETEDAVAFCSKAQHPWDIVVSAFTLHNLGREHQIEVLKGIRGVLGSGGVFVLADYAVKEGDDRIVSFRKHVEELFDVLIPKAQYMALKEWIVHTLDDMQDTRVQDETELLKMLAAAGFPKVRASFVGSLEAVFECPLP